MSDEVLTEEVLEELSTKARAALSLPAQAPAGRDAELVLALVEEVRRMREAERRREQHAAYTWLERARREGTAVSLGRSGWALPPITAGSAWTAKKQPGSGLEQPSVTWTVESGPDANGNFLLRCDKPTRELTADELRRDFVAVSPR